MIKFENPNNGRFYYIDIQNDMLDDMVIRVIFGGRFIRRIRTIFCDNLNTLSKEVNRLSKRRIKRGYVLI